MCWIHMHCIVLHASIIAHIVCQIGDVVDTYDNADPHHRTCGPPLSRYVVNHDQMDQSSFRSCPLLVEMHICDPFVSKGYVHRTGLSLPV